MNMHEKMIGSGKPMSASKQAKAMRQRASKALSNARQRCTNDNNPDFPAYGAVGVKVLFKGVDELIAAIGLPSDGHSLDRIDPNGHYEPGNVRWTTAAVQGANKKKSPVNSHLSLVAQVAQIKDAHAAQENREHVAAAWPLIFAAFKRGYFHYDDVLFLAENLKCPGVIEANFDVNTDFDHLNQKPGTMHLPALSMPNARIRIRSGPCRVAKFTDRLCALGRSAGLEEFAPSWNVPAPLGKRIAAWVASQSPGLFLVGQPSAEDLLGGWIEGCLLSMAGPIEGFTKKLVAFFPMLTVSRELSQIGSPALWDEVSHPLLHAGFLMIPDFHLDCGSWGEFPSNKWWLVERLLAYREKMGARTIVGIQNVSKLPSGIKNIVCSSYDFVEMKAAKPHEVISLEYGESGSSIPSGALNMKLMKDIGEFRRLVVHYGLINT